MVGLTQPYHINSYIEYKCSIHSNGRDFYTGSFSKKRLENLYGAYKTCT